MSFAQLFLPGLPEERARSQLAPMVTALQEEAVQRLAERAASTNGGPAAGPAPRDESPIAVMAGFGTPREEAIENLILKGGI